uniref:Cytochrome n=3 Tax=Rhodnius prolixus TaxID=13249 RepID=A0ABL0EJX2_RHOPR
MWWVLSQYFLTPLSLLGLVALLIYYYGTNTYNYWKKKGVPYIKPKFPFLGNTYEVVFSLKAVIDKQLEFYNHFDGQRFGGIFSFKAPILFIKDPELVESVLIKDFTSFYNRGMKVDLKLDPLSAHLVNLEDKQWKSLRQKLTPTFSSGKLKGMHQQLVDCSEALVEYICNHVEKSEPIEAREVMAKFSTDVIGSCAFGLNTNALKDPDSEFRKMGKKIFQPSFKTRLRFAMRVQYPQLVSLLRWKGISETLQKFFTSLLNTTMEFREKNNVFRNDFVQLLMELKKQESEKKINGVPETDHIIIDDSVIVSNAFVFFVAGFETTASTLGFCLYELSLHQDVQEQAYQHILSVLKKHGGEITYDAVKEMTFLNQIFAETLRMHPPASELRRIVTKDYLIPGTKLMLPKDSRILIPVHSLQNDPKYFPEPEKFKPERFSADIRKGTYLPFGDGPRICIGRRFAKMEMHVAMVKLLLNYKFSLNSKTISPLIYNPAAFLLVPVGGIWLDVQKRI